MIHLEPINETYVRLSSDDPNILYNLSKQFTFIPKNARYMKKSGGWDGKIRLLDYKGKLFTGLIPEVEKYAKENNIELSGVTLNRGSPNFSIDSFIDKLNFPEYIEKRPYQWEAINQAIYNRRCILESATNSGKSLIAYVLSQYYKEKKILIVVPTIALTKQMLANFYEYEQTEQLDDTVHIIHQGKSKDFNSRITIATFQSLVRMSPHFFEEIDMVIVDECHRSESKSISKVVSWCTNADIRIGMTGSLKDSKTHKMTLTGLIGPIIPIITASESIKQGDSTPLRIKILLLNHKKPRPKFKDYHKEIEYILSDKNRMRYLIKLANTLKGHTLILFRYTDTHGKIIRDELKKTSKLEIFYIDKDTKDRETFREYISNNSDSITVASMGTTSTGINIPKLNNIILAHPYKGKIPILQSIGRGLRKFKGKKYCDWYDIGDYFQYETTAIRQLRSRIKLYNKEGYYEYKIKEIDLSKIS